MFLKRTLCWVGLSIVIFEPMVSTSQTQVVEEWVATYRPPNTDSTMCDGCMVLDQAGNIYVTGRAYSSSTGVDYLTIKYAANGSRAWAVQYDGGHPNDSYQAKAIAVDSLGNVYVTGSPETIKYNPSGSQIWARTLEGPQSMDVDVADNLYLIYGYLAIKFTPAGSQVWRAEYRGPGNIDSGIGGILDASGRVHGTGISYNSSGNGDMATVQFGPDGQLNWSRRFDGALGRDDQGTAIALDRSGNVLVTGGTTAGTADVSTQHYDYLTIKYDASGQRQWVAQDSVGGVRYSYAKAIAVDSNGNSFVTGSSSGPSTGSDFATIKYSPNGTTLWIRRYDGLAGTLNDNAVGVVVDSLGNAYVTGSSEWGGALRNTDMATIKYNSAGHQIWLASYGLDQLGDIPNAIAIDANRAVVVAGTSYGGLAVIKYSQEQQDCNANGTGDELDVFGGTSADCNTNSVPDECEKVTCAGACCLGDGTCMVLREALCRLFAGARWAGPDTTCVNVNGAVRCPLGACCLADGLCAADRTEASCAAEGGTFRGFATTCQGANCPQPSGACCLVSGGCLSLSRADCNVFPGATWAGALTTCVDVGGTPRCPLGACCLADGTCREGVLPAACLGLGGTHRPGGVTCAQAACPQPSGACCLSSGSCLSATQAECGLFGGATWAGGFTACADVQGTPTCPLGACCLPDGRCVGGVLTAACTAQGGTFRGPGSGCVNANCPQPTGACCLANGSCIVLLRADCQAAPNNRWAGANTTCVDGNANGRADACESVPGDINGDSVANPGDIPPFVAVMLGMPQAPEHVARADVNGDGTADGRDVGAQVGAILGTP